MYLDQNYTKKYNLSIKNAKQQLMLNSLKLTMRLDMEMHTQVLKHQEQQTFQNSMVVH